MYKKTAYLLALALTITLTACGDDTHANASVEDDGQPFFYKRHAQDADGNYLKDSLTYPGNQPRDADGTLRPEPVRDWTFVDQLDRPISNTDLRGKVHIVDFFFTACPTICPKVKGQMLRIEEEFADDPDFALVSFTVDPKRDTPERMKDYATKLGITDMDRWRFVHGDKFEIYDLDAEYLSIAEENANAPGGFDHSGYIVLVDRDGFVRSYASGLDPAEVDFLMDDIRLLLDQPSK
ncbi:SCO family protein [Neolewinella antarctica]|uniref:Protein SCO1/2 n=1 Tax=Neolewinella antarctica TaxID=442734 RepID=A0ABX0XF82_9BACT|nr:SCO family protein [Neolewinella antarctica]NJC27574.1 protein SCO1/2 [Neolewinella antarctica]